MGLTPADAAPMEASGREGSGGGLATSPLSVKGHFCERASQCNLCCVLLLQGKVPWDDKDLRSLAVLGQVSCRISLLPISEILGRKSLEALRAVLSGESLVRDLHAKPALEGDGLSALGCRRDYPCCTPTPARPAS